MTTPLKELLSDFSGQSGASEEEIAGVEQTLGLRFPQDYRNFLSAVNGGEGFIGKHYLVLWRVEELSKLNHDYQVPEYAPGFLVFALTGGGDAFAFDTRQTPFRVHQMPFIGMSPEDSFLVADNFMNLLERMVATNGPLF